MRHLLLAAVLLVACADADAGTPDSGTRDGGMDAGEDTGEDPCGGACDGETPHCDVGSDTCVACLEASHCDASAPVCGPGGTCGSCTGPGDCNDYPDTPLCDDGGDGACVACVDHDDCTAPDAAQCDATTHTCVPCNDSAQCTEDGEGVCDESGASGVCVECTIDTEATACGDFSCNPATNECTETERGTVPDCGQCVADSECGPDHLCIPMEFDGEPLPNGFCLRTQASGCARPYAVTLIVAESLSGAAEASYCGVDQATTTCDAVRALRDARGCPSGPADCASEGARCETIGPLDNQCTYTCGNNNQCPSGLDCATDYCGS